MVSFSRLSWVPAAAWLAVQASSPGDVACVGACTEDAGSDDASLLSTVVGRSKASVGRHRYDAQRNDDFVPVSPPGATSPASFPTALVPPSPLPPPNPANNSLINGYIPSNCTVETWPWFMDVPGTWYGDQGQNFIALPQANAQPLGKNFLVQVNHYSETITFQHVGPVLNRGYTDGLQVPPLTQSDQVFSGVIYHESVHDLDLDMGIHEENGFFLHQACRPENSLLIDEWQVMRAGAIPHGSQPMGFGNITVVDTPDPDYYLQMLLRLRESFVFSVQPVVPGCGPRYQQQSQPGNNTGPLAEAGGACCLKGGGYMKGQDQCPQTGCPEPIDMLIEAVKGLNVVNYVQLNLSTEDTIAPYVPSGMWFPGTRGGGVQNTAYVNINVMAETRSFKNMNWYLTVQRPDGTTYNIIQYIQTVDLKFLAKQAGCPDQLWPHVDANTLYRSEVSTTTVPPTTEAPTAAPTTTASPAEMGVCNNLMCGCRFPKFKSSWCTDDRCALGPWCSRSKANCHTCMGAWCPEKK